MKIMNLNQLPSHDWKVAPLTETARESPYSIGVNSLDSHAAGSPQSSVPIVGEATVIRCGASSANTYDHLLERSRIHPAFRGKIHYFNNHKSTLKQWLTGLGMNLASQIGDEFGVDFNRELGRGLEACGHKQGTRGYNERKCHLRKLQSVRALLDEPLSDERPFHEVFSQVALPLKGSGMLQRILGVGVGSGTVWSWLNGTYHPEKRMVPRFTRLEQELHLPAGTLTSRIYQGPSRRKSKTCLSENGRRTKKLLASKYRCHLRDWPERLQVEWARYVQEKTQSLLTIDNLTSDQAGWSADRPGKGTYSVELNVQEGFFGFLRTKGSAKNAIDRGIFNTATAMGPNPGPVEGLRREELLSMGLLSDASLIIEYLEFRRARSPRNLYTTDTLRTLKVVLCMLAEHTGFVWKNSAIFATHPHFQGKLPTSRETTGGRRQLRNPDQQWKEWCRVNHEKLDAVRRKLVKKKLIKRSRDPSEPIQAILDYRRPWELLFLMEKRMWREPMPISWSKRDLAAEFELRLLISFLIRYPFRIGTYERILVGDLRWVSQSLQLWLAPERFKNHHYLDDQTYKIEIDAALIPRINTYLEQHRPILHTDAPSEHLFPLPTNGSAGEPRRYFESKIAAGIRSFSQHYLHDYVPAGFHPQAVRDIIATHLILEDPIGGWARAAIALWDKIGTVHRHYAYLENVDFLRDHTASVTKMSSVFQSRP